MAKSSKSTPLTERKKKLPKKLPEAAQPAVMTEAQRRAFVQLNGREPS